jgi:rhodanese-related sulfurtransferase
VFLASFLSVANYFLQQQDIAYGNINTEQARYLIKTKRNLVIIDVRTPLEHNTNRIEGSINLCVTCNPQNLLNNLNQNDEILVYCLSGSRSALAMQILNENNYEKVFNLLGGIRAWIDSGYPVTKI